MPDLTFRHAETYGECEAAFELASGIFNDTSTNDLHGDIKKLSWEYYESFRPENLIIGLNRHKIVGVLRICPVVMPWYKRNFRVAGLSSICVAKEYQGQGFGRALMEKSVVYLDDENFDFSFLIARRAVDHFYTKFGFFGASSYQSFKCKFEREQFEGIIGFSNFKIENSSSYLEFFHSNYKQCFGATCRGEGFWRYAINRLLAIGLNFKEVIFEGDLIGYIVHRDLSIVECGFSMKIPQCIIRQSMIEFSAPQSNLQMNLPHDHMITDSLNNVDVEFYSRKCLFGGHMIRWSEKIDKLNFSIGKSSQSEKPFFFNISLLDEV